MKSYLVLTPPGGTDPDHNRTIFLADGFSWLALIFPWIWLLTKRLWLAAAIVFLLQLLAGRLIQVAGFEVAGFLFALAINLAVALEGRHFYSETLIRRGWTLDAVLTADTLDTAEELYFSGQQSPEIPERPAAPDWARRGEARPGTGWDQGGIGIFDHHGGR
ncbi:MAG: DUF2628 domain-containing protein [Rhizobiales bacterium]|nr:DUF2628 domain-containing protein [Hyphomicrobiales bacterium]